MSDYISEFIDALRKAGYGPARTSDIKPTSRIIRYQIDGDHNKNGWFVLYLEDNFAAGSYGSWKTGEKHKWSSKFKKDVSQEDRERIKAEIKARQEANAKAELDRNKEAAHKAKRLWDRSSPVSQHEYLTRKQITGDGLRVIKNALVVPMYADGKLCSLQFIAGDGRKRFLTGGKIKGCYYPIADKDDDKSIIYICEGISTGYSVRAAMGGYPVIVAFNAGNLSDVAQYFKSKYAYAEIILCADNDSQTVINGKPYNTGIEKANQAAVKVGGRVIWPESPTGEACDFNDSYIKLGPDYVKNRISAAVVTVADPLPAPPTGGEGANLEGLPLEAYDIPPTENTKNVFQEDAMPFKILGHNKGHYYFLPSSGGEVVDIPASGMSSISSLFRLAPLDYWHEKFDQSKDKSMGHRKLGALSANALMQTAHQIGIFRPQNVRGVGAWIDDGRPILHCGDEILVNGESIPPYKFDSKFIYPLRPIRLDFKGDALPSSEAVKLRDICKKLSWERPLSADLLAGWCVVAPVCGALPWRPHIWVTGESESGKTTVTEDIISPMLGALAVRTDGGTTEAALRQEIEIDGRPVLYDEAESESQKDKTIMENVLQMARRSSSGATIFKGGAGGEVQRYVIRSCFCFVAINPALKHRADISRVTKLLLVPANFPDKDEYFVELMREIRETITPEYANAMLTRTIRNLPTLLENCKVFADAAASVLNNRRAADQIGVMLAGAYLLTSTKRVDYDTAVKWISQHDWQDHTAIGEETDPEKLLTYISTRMIRFSPSVGTSREITIGNMIRRYYKNSDDDAMNRLREYGVWPRSDGVLIANNSPNLGEILEDSPWTSWRTKLPLIPGAEKLDSLLFAPGLKSRSVRIPKELFDIVETSYRHEEELSI